MFTNSLGRLKSNLRKEAMTVKQQKKRKMIVIFCETENINIETSTVP